MDGSETVPLTPPALPSNEQQGDTKKKVQAPNRLIKISSFATLVISVLGFSPSIITAMKEREFWSVSHDLPHTDNDYLLPHSIFVGVWLLCLIANFYSGP